MIRFNFSVQCPTTAISTGTCTIFIGIEFNIESARYIKQKGLISSPGELFGPGRGFKSRRGTHTSINVYGKIITAVVLVLVLPKTLLSSIISVHTCHSVWRAATTRTTYSIVVVGCIPPVRPRDERHYILYTAIHI